MLILSFILQVISVPDQISFGTFRFTTFINDADSLFDQRFPSLQLSQYLNKVPEGGLEPPRLAAHAPEACTSTNSVTRAYSSRLKA